MPDQPQSHFDRFLRPLLASRFLTISALIHLLLILLFGGRVLFNKYVEPPDFQSAGDTVSTESESAPPPPPPDASLPAPPTVSAPPPPAVASMVALTSFSPTSSAFSMPVPVMAPPALSNQISSQVQQSFGTGVGPALPVAMSGRGSGQREETAERFGQKPESEQAVMRALQWLQTKQNTDGTWGVERDRGGFTGLALLCYLGHGETPQTSREFGLVVNNAINAILLEGNQHQGRLSFGDGFDDEKSPYEHGICTYALCEAYTMTKDPKLAPLVRQAVNYIIQGQRPDGSWAYRYDTTGGDTQFGPKSDTSVTGWQIQALKAAHLTGLPGMEEKVHPALDKAMQFLDQVYSEKDGSFGYRKAGDRTSLTGVGVLSKLLWLGRADHTVHEGLKNIQSKDLSYSGPDCNLYTWYYDTQACFQAQGGAWDWWNARFQKQLTDTQSSDGSWPPTGGGETGSDYATNTSGNGPVYRTTLCCLMLEVFYRYLPSSQDTSMGGGQIQGL